MSKTLTRPRAATGRSVRSKKAKAKTKKAKAPKRSYPAQLVARAKVMREVEKATWPQVAAELGVPMEGIRYAVNAYAPEVDTSDLEVAEAAEHLKAVVAEASALLVVLEKIMKSSSEAMESMASLIDSVSRDDNPI